MLLCGAAAGEVIAELAPYGMNLEDFGTEIGRATATKMFRSIVVKGLEALFLECVMAASRRSEEHTSELQSLMRNSYAVFCLKKKNTTNQTETNHNTFRQLQFAYGNPT